MGKSVVLEKENTLAVTAGKIYSGIVTVFLFIALMVFPLYYDNYYFNILKAKYIFYYVSVLSMLFVFLVITLIFAFIDQKEYGGSNRRRILAGLAPKQFWKTSTWVDKTLIAFFAFALISTLQSDYRYEAFWGNEGRFSGLFLIFLYTSSVFLIGKFGKIKKWYMEAFLISGAAVCMLGILDYFKIDLLGFKTFMKESDKVIFTSTLGNINTYTAFVALVVGASAGLFVSEKNPFRAFFHYVLLLVAFFAIVTGQSDNAYLAIGVLFALLPLVLFVSRKGIRRYVMTLAGFMTVLKLIADINVQMPDEVIGLSGVFQLLTEYDKLLYIVIALWCVVIGLYLSEYFRSKKMLKADQTDRVGNWLRILWGGLLLVVIGTVIYVLYDANFGGNADKYGAVSQYVIFNDSWGTNRGYCWRIGWESYMALPLHHKLFGFGPDTFGILTWPYREEALLNYGVFFESAHNEYFQYLVTMGPFALLAYLAFLGSACKRMLKKMAACPWVLAPLAAAVCYGAQALVNINLPIATPVMWTLLAVGVAVCRDNGSANKMEDVT